MFLIILRISTLKVVKTLLKVVASIECTSGSIDTFINRILPVGMGVGGGAFDARANFE